MARTNPMDSWRFLAEVLGMRDPKLQPLIETIGPPTLKLRKEAYRALAESILSQQLAVKAADSIIRRFAELESPFPKPASVLKWRKERLRKVGVSSQKAVYLKALSEKWADSEWRSGWSRLEDAEIISRLVEVKGIGEWTAHMFLIFSLGRPNVLPTGDFGIRRGIQLLLGKKEMPLPKQIPGLVSHWEGAYSIASWYLWKAQDRKLLVASSDR